jgi:hypothetical protein
MKTIKLWCLIENGVYGLIGVPNENICGFTEPIFDSRKRALKYKKLMFGKDKKTKVIPCEIKIK